MNFKYLDVARNKNILTQIYFTFLISEQQSQTNTGTTWNTKIKSVLTNFAQISPDYFEDDNVIFSHPFILNCNITNIFRFDDVFLFYNQGWQSFRNDRKKSEFSLFSRTLLEFSGFFLIMLFDYIPALMSSIPISNLLFLSNWRDIVVFLQWLYSSKFEDHYNSINILRSGVSRN
jgi:hypothetical protein